MSKIFGKNYRYQTIMNWVKKAVVRVLEEKLQQEQMDVVEMDELYTHMLKKERKTRVQTAVDREKLRITAFEVGPEKASVLRKLINIIGENNIKIVCTDGNCSYEEELGKNAYLTPDFG